VDLLQRIRNGLDAVPPLVLPDFGRVSSSVLVAIIQREHGPVVVLTRRSTDLPDHAGEISFPGGRVEPGESTLDAALREAQEEIGLNPGGCQWLGQLDDSHTVTGYRITPHVVLSEHTSAWTLSHREVAEVLEIPVEPLLSRGRGYQVEVSLGRERNTFPLYPIPGGVIWGATARILGQLMDRLVPESSSVQKAIADRRAIAALLAMRSAFITTHVNPDGDAIGSCVAMEELFKTLGIPVTILLDAPPPPDLDFLLTGSNWLAGDAIRMELAADAERMVVVDTGDRKRIGKVAEVLDHMELPPVVLDHHLSGDIEGDVLRDPSCSSTAELVYRLFRTMGFPFRQRTVDALYTGILSDTNGFRYIENRSSPFKAASHLVDLGADATAIQEALYSQISPRHVALSGVVASRILYECDGRLAWSWLTLEDLSARGATADDAGEMAPMLLAIRGVQVAAFFREVEPGRFKLSMRSLKAVPIVGICNELGGGGHAHAAGATVDGPVEKLVEFIAGRCR
jgi:phosphoesterase RecJ-like protein